MTNEEKAREIANYTECNGMACWQCKEYVAIKMAQWKDEQLIEQLTFFAQHLNKRGAFRNDLCMDFEHEAQSFIEFREYNNKEL